MPFRYRTMVQSLLTTSSFPYPDGTDDLGEAAAQALVLGQEAQKHSKEDGVPRRIMIEVIFEEPSNADHEARAEDTRQLTLFPGDTDSGRESRDRSFDSSSTPGSMGLSAGED